MKPLFLFLLPLIVASTVTSLVWKWYDYNYVACAYISGAMDYKHSLVFEDGTHPVITENIHWKPKEGDYTACWWAGKELKA